MVRKINKILLINPRNRAIILEESNSLNFGKMFPLGMGYIAAYLESKGYQVDILDTIAEGFENREQIDKDYIRIGISDELLIDKVCRSRPDMVGISCLFSPQDKELEYMARLIKEHLPEVPIVVGGAHPSCAPEIVLERPEVDYIVIGEGEKVIEELLFRLNNNKSLEGQQSLGYRDDSGITHINKGFNFVEDIDTLPMPAYHLFDISEYFGKMAVQGERFTERFLPLITSRGCPFDCTFCTAHQVWGHKYRWRSPEKIVEEMEYLRDKYDLQEIVFVDDNITLDMRRAEKLFDLMIERKLDLIWTVPNGIAPYALTPQLLDKMKRAGCRVVNFAIESGSQRVLKEIIKKPLNLKKVSPLIKHAKAIGLVVGGFFICGMPGETLEEIRETFRFIRRHKISSANISIAFPLPGSKMYEIAIEKNYLVNSNPYNDIRALSSSSYQIQTPDWSVEQLRNTVGFEIARSKIYILLCSPSLLLRFLTKNPKYVLMRFVYELASLLRNPIFGRIARLFRSIRLRR
jgi:magnesium-protoporphyrin IX monomethyl ester (oxidative) cyclase